MKMRMTIAKGTMRKVLLLIGMGVVVTSMLLFALACANATAEEVSTEETTGTNFVGAVTVEPQRAPAGTLAVVSGTDFPSGEHYDLVWHTVDGSWDIRGDRQEEYHGRVFSEVEYTIAEVVTDAQGSFSTSFIVPDDYGFVHNISIQRDGELLNRVGFAIESTISMEPTSGPPGTLISITMSGIGWQKMENSWTLMYDNRYTGFLSAVTTRGTAEVVIPATGGPGKHILKILHGAYQYPYLNTEQNPRPDQPSFEMEFIITDEPPILPVAAETQGFMIESGSPPADVTGAFLWVDPMVGPIGTPVTLHAGGFSAGENITFLWYSVVGNRVSGSGWSDNSIELGTATVKPDGSLSLPFTVPDDLGGGHRIEAVVAADNAPETTFTITPSILPLGISAGSVGMTLTVHLKGVGWTETANIYHLVYDNAYLGYACGFNSQGDVTIYLPLTGEPGWHFIDLYPGIYKGKEAKGVQNFRVPQLTYREDHPGETLPAFHLAVEITE